MLSNDMSQPGLPGHEVNSMENHQAEQTEQGRSSKLPKLPPKAKVKSDHLSFREPGYGFAVERFRRLDEKIKLLQTEEAKLKEEQENFRETCRKDLEQIRRQPSQLELHAVFNYIPALKLFEEICDALSKAISSGDSEGQQRRESARLDEVRKRLKRKKETIEMTKQMMRSCDRTLKKLEKDLNKMNEKSLEEDLPELSGKDHGLNCEDNEDQKDSDNDIRKENRSENDDEDESEDTGDRTEKGNEREKQIRIRAKQIRITPQDREEAIKMTKEMLQRKNEKRIQGLQEMIDQEKKKSEGYHERCKKAMASVKKLEEREKILMEKQSIDERKQDETDGEEDRLDKADEQIAEWSKQKERRDTLRSMQETVRRLQRRGFNPRFLKGMSELSDDESELDELGESNEQKFYKRLEKILEDARALEDMITNDRWLRDNVDRKRDLRIVLGAIS